MIVKGQKQFNYMLEKLERKKQQQIDHWKKYKEKQFRKLTEQHGKIEF